jgi:hypothetical protein
MTIGNQLSGGRYYVYLEKVLSVPVIMKRYLILQFLIAILSNAYGQNIEKVYLDQADTTRNNYTIIYPPTINFKGYLILLPGFGETPEKVMQQTALPIRAAQNGILTIIPTLQEGVTSFGIDTASQQALRRVIDDVTSKIKLIDRPMYIGGFSLGGSTAIKYAENPLIKPAAVFSIDPPLDFERFYNSAKRDIRLSKNEQPNQENVYMVQRIEQIMGGSPLNALQAYHRTSPYSYADTTQAAIKSLTMPLRIYSEPDLNWWIKNRGADFSNMNVTDGSAMVNELNRLGNKNAELIITQNKGFRKPANNRHPHSWSIADNDELIKWLLAHR